MRNKPSLNEEKGQERKEWEVSLAMSQDWKSKKYLG